MQQVLLDRLQRERCDKDMVQCFEAVNKMLMVHA